MNAPTWLSNRWIGRMRSSWEFGQAMDGPIVSLTIGLVALTLLVDPFPRVRNLEVAVALAVLILILAKGACYALYQIGTTWIDERVAEDKARRKAAQEEELK